MSCCLFVSLSLLAVLEVNARSVVINNSTVQNTPAANKVSNATFRKDIMDQLYQETMLRFQIEKEVHTLAQKVAALEKRKTPEKGKGFYAYVSKDLANPGGGHTIVYDVVMTNYANRYNGHTGIFTVPTDGLYSFTWVTRVECGGHYTSDLHVNNKVAGSVYIYCGYNSAAGNAIVDLRKDDVVFVRTLAGSGMIKSNEYGRTSFSGFLVG